MTHLIELRSNKVREPAASSERSNRSVLPKAWRVNTLLLPRLMDCTEYLCCQCQKWCRNTLLLFAYQDKLLYLLKNDFEIV